MAQMSFLIFDFIAVEEHVVFFTVAYKLTNHLNYVDVGVESYFNLSEVVELQP